MGAVEAFKYLNITKPNQLNWDIFPCNFADLSAAMDAIPTVSPLKEPCWRVLIAILCAPQPAPSFFHSASTTRSGKGRRTLFWFACAGN